MLEGQPSAGVRLELVLVEQRADEAVYQGHAHLPTSSLGLSVVSNLKGATASFSDGAAASELVQAAIVRLATTLVRAATKRELESGEPPPKRIVRWRPLDVGG